MDMAEHKREDGWLVGFAIWITDGRVRFPAKKESGANKSVRWSRRCKDGIASSQ